MNKCLGQDLVWSKCNEASEPEKSLMPSLKCPTADPRLCRLVQRASRTLRCITMRNAVVVRFNDTRAVNRFAIRPRPALCLATFYGKNPMSKAQSRHTNDVFMCETYFEKIIECFEKTIKRLVLQGCILFKMSRMQDALWLVFQHISEPNLLCLPSVARDQERHWVLSQDPN